MAQTKKRQYKKAKEVPPTPITRQYEMYPVYSILVGGKVYTSKSLSDEVAEKLESTFRDLRSSWR